MNHRDAEIADIVVVLHQSYSSRIPVAVELLVGAGFELITTDEENNVVEGSIESFKVQDLQKLECVNYVRTVLTYIADYPVGDPRDQDLTEDEGEDAA